MGELAFWVGVGVLFVVVARDMLSLFGWTWRDSMRKFEWVEMGTLKAGDVIRFRRMLVTLDEVKVKGDLVTLLGENEDGNKKVFSGLVDEAVEREVGSDD